MIRLLWKEWREQRWISTIWILTVLGIGLFGRGQSFFGQQLPAIWPWQFLSWIMASLAGMMAYSSEISRRRSQFILSRPVTSVKLLAGKLLFAGVILIGAPLLTVAVYACICEPAYRPLLSVANIAFGVWSVAWKMGVFYLAGFCCSLIVPGIAGGMLTLAGVSLVSFAITAVIPSNGHNINVNTAYVLPFITLVGLWIALVIAACSLIGGGLRHDLNSRLKRAIPVFIGVFLIYQAFVACVPPERLMAVLFRWERVEARISPGGTYVIILEKRRYFLLGLSFNWLQDDYIGERFAVVRLNDGIVMRSLQSMNVVNTSMVLTPSEIFSEWRWITDAVGTYSVMMTDGKRGQFSSYIGQRYYCIDFNSGAEVSVVSDSRCAFIPSPDEKYILITAFPKTVENDGWHNFIFIVTPESDYGRLVKIPLAEGLCGLNFCYWNSKTSLIYDAYRTVIDTRRKSGYRSMRLQVTVDITTLTHQVISPEGK